MGVSKQNIIKLRISYAIVCIVAALLLLTEYSFTLDFLNYILAGIIIIYPIIELVRSSVQVWIKILTVISMIVLIVYIVSVNIFASAFGDKIKRTFIKWNIDGYKITLYEKQGWAGGPFKQFDLVKYRIYGLINKTVAYAFSEQEPVNPCKIQFSEHGYPNNGDGYREKPLYMFDSCTKTIKSIKQH